MKRIIYYSSAFLLVLLFLGIILTCEKVRKEEHYADLGELSPVAVVINRSKQEETGLPVPYSYQDLLSPIFSGYIAMPNPKTTVIGYKILLNLINTLGEDEAFEFFDKLAENNIHFTEFDSDPLFALTNGKTTIGFCFVSTILNAVKLTDFPLEICFIEEGLSNPDIDFDCDQKKLLLEKWKY